MDEERKVDVVGSAVGSAMVKIRWAKATKAQRLAVGKMLAAARARKKRQQGKVRSQGSGRKARKS